MSPFSKETAKEASQKGLASRWAGKDPRKQRTEPLTLRVTPEDIDMIAEMAASLGVSRAEYVIRALRAYMPEGMREKS